jgi:transcriptional regulator with XRE-family HTH domain
MFGVRLKNLRTKHHWTIEDVADKINVARSTYAGYETEDRKPPIKNLIKLSKLYNVSVDYILGLTDEPNIREIEYDASKYLRKGNLNWNGVPLTDEELEPIIKLFEMIVRDRIPNSRKEGE